MSMDAVRGGATEQAVQDTECNYGTESGSVLMHASGSFLTVMWQYIRTSPGRYHYVYS